MIFWLFFHEHIAEAGMSQLQRSKAYFTIEFIDQNFFKQLYLSNYTIFHWRV